MVRSMRWVALTVVAVGLLALEVHLEWSHRTAQGREVQVEALKAQMAPYLSEDVEPPAQSVLASDVAVRPRAGRPGTHGNWRELFDAWEARHQDEEARARWDEARRWIANAGSRRGNGTLEGEGLALLNASLAANVDIVEGVVTLTQRGAAFPNVASAAEEMELHERLSEFSDLLDGDAMVRSRTGEYPRAIERVTAKTALTGGSRFLHYPGTPVTLKVVDEALRRTDAAAPYWDRFLDQLGESRSHEMFVGQMAHNSKRVVNRYARFPMRADKGITEDPVGFLERWAYRYPGAPVYNRHLSTFSGAMTEMLRLAPQPYFEVADRVEDLVVSLPPEGTLLATRCHWVSALRGSAERFARQAHHEANIDLTTLAIHLERYRAERGAYPERLDALAQYYGGVVPVDPLSGRPYHYTPTGQRYRLYAPGPKAEKGRDARIIWPGSV